MPQLIPQSVIDKDHKLEGSHDRASLELAKHRWHQCLDPAGPQHSIRGYAKAIGRSQKTIVRSAKGYAIYVERMSEAPGASVAGFTIQDAIRLADQSAEMQEFSEAIAEGSGQPIAQVARGDNSRRTREVIQRAKDRAERRGTDPVDEARKIATEDKALAAGRKRRRTERTQRHSLQWLRIEGSLVKAKKELLAALAEAEDVSFDEDELDLLRDSIGKVRAVLDLVDLRMAGTPDIDWDAELAKLGSES